MNVCMYKCIWELMKHALNGFFLIIDKHRREHNLAEAFNAPGNVIVVSRFVLPCYTNVVERYASCCN